MTIKQLTVVKAYLDGLKIESKVRNTKTYTIDYCPNWNWTTHKYRVAKSQHTHIERWLCQHDNFMLIVETTGIKEYCAKFGGTPVKCLGGYMIYQG